MHLGISVPSGVTPTCFKRHHIDSQILEVAGLTWHRITLPGSRKIDMDAGVSPESSMYFDDDFVFMKWGDAI